LVFKSEGKINLLQLPRSLEGGSLGFSGRSLQVENGGARRVEPRRWNQMGAIWRGGASRMAPEGWGLKVRPCTTSGLYYENSLTIINDACTINVLHLSLSLCFSLS
jgi:hypothetical protein